MSCQFKNVSLLKCLAPLALLGFQARAQTITQFVYPNRSQVLAILKMPMARGNHYCLYKKDSQVGFIVSTPHFGHDTSPLPPRFQGGEALWEALQVQVVNAIEQTTAAARVDETIISPVAAAAIASHQHHFTFVAKRFQHLQGLMQHATSILDSWKGVHGPHLESFGIWFNTDAKTFYYSNGLSSKPSPMLFDSTNTIPHLDPILSSLVPLPQWEELVPLITVKMIFAKNPLLLKRFQKLEKEVGRLEKILSGVPNPTPVPRHLAKPVWSIFMDSFQETEEKVSALTATLDDVLPLESLTSGNNYKADLQKLITFQKVFFHGQSFTEDALENALFYGLGANWTTSQLVKKTLNTLNSQPPGPGALDPCPRVLPVSGR